MDIILNYDGDNFSWILIQECCDFLQCVQCTSLMDFPNNTFLRTTHMNQLKPFNWWIERERERERVWVALQRLWSWNIAHETNGRARCHSRNHTYPTSIPSLHSKEENQSRFLKKRRVESQIKQEILGNETGFCLSNNAGKNLSDS